MALAILGFAGVIEAPWPAVAESQSREEGQASAKVIAFDEAWEKVRTSFYDPKLRGLDWTELGRKYRARAATPGENLAAVVNDLLAELGASHMGYYTPEEPAYYDLADIFSHSLRRDLEKRFANGEVSYDGVGMMTRIIEGRVFITGLLAGYPADAAKLKVGDEILAAEGKDFTEVASFRGRAGQKVRLTIRRRAGGEPMAIDVTPKAIHPNRAYLDAMENGARLIEKDGHRLAYVHIWSYARRVYQELLEDLIAGRFKDADALIWDLRDGWGGAQPEYLDIFNGRSPTMVLNERNRESTVNARWRKPVLLLINGGTRSGKEVLAQGFKSYGYGEVVGARSAGAVLAARAFMQSNGNLLLIAVSDVAVDKVRLEGVGVAPDHEVPFDIRYAEGADPQLDRAIDILIRKLN